MASHASTAAGRRRTTTRRKPVAKRRAPAKPKPKARSPQSARPRPRRAAPARTRTKAGARSAVARWATRIAMAAAAVLLLAAGYFFWLRDSSLVAVNDVKVSGLSPSPQRSEIEGALTHAGEGMTTLHLQPADLKAAVARFPTVAGVEADADFPHGLHIKVIERPPALIATDGESDVAVAADGEVLPGVDAQGDQLPTLNVDKIPSSGALAGQALQEALVAGAAPAPLAPLVEDIAYQGDSGVTLTMKGGIELRFGDAGKAAGKWAAVAAVLADPRLDALTYVDVRVPKRPAVGGTGEGATSTPPETATTPTTPTT